MTSLKHPYTNLSLKAATVDSVRDFLGYSSLTEFVEKAVEEKLAREKAKRKVEAVATLERKGVTD